MSAWEVTQYYRGELYTFVDYLFDRGAYDTDELDEVIDFLKCVMRAIVVFLKKLKTW